MPPILRPKGYFQQDMSTILLSMFCGGPDGRQSRRRWIIGHIQYEQISLQLDGVISTIALNVAEYPSPLGLTIQLSRKYSGCGKIHGWRDFKKLWTDWQLRTVHRIVRGVNGAELIYDF
ncbi:hypothetical protein RvY_18591 [Ramazzottius varieornatus]|uniref:Uncharacterized protein n=1 Tax=Ramazzottius varieornatus TaxID=947166 RepID=A0A1D1WBG5_RAMVA|nr:hypothetical protein RvY_18591 [Ramazzottius varieornatus]